ncbi:TatD family hydrolase [Ectothiorhodospira lacustris]|uniref:TatD family hydrolase n=1 Tax=Ectothiorhodospira lacustris TaxID=2899127 RepID=UPI001EE78F4D|nr:TatD family hydrolase [Ectothiorhodospira lacustris]MCG5500705.1 TatD family hydrolase [Ectothiorhodospira lacustris]MCG5509076.1 TatD family hydrolase [Ectothiorhodospira lacustris]MCG5520867.1 TatD family hydrolase [Ectothiorhodospira lacustris]
MLIDSHCHFDVPAFDADREACRQRAREAGVQAMIIPAITRADWPRLRAVATSASGLYPAYGLHPVYLASHRPDDIHALDQWLQREPAVAVGECGLDFFAEGLDEKTQQACFRAQLDLALTHDLPVIIHARRAVDQVTQALRQRPGLRGVVHSFSGSRQQAEKLLDLGFLLGLGGPLTYPRAQRLRALAAWLPAQALLVESDAPDQPGQTHRGQRNEPAWLPEVVQTLATLRNEPPEEIARITRDNAIQLFRLDRLNHIPDDPPLIHQPQTTP